MSIGGHVQDTTTKAPLENAVVMAVRLNDSILISHTRTDSKGFFLLNTAIDTLQIIISHPKFNDQSYYVFGSTTNNEFDFGKIILPPKSHTLQEIIIYAYKDPVFYKGDTLIYTADSFKVKPNATVEDLLKKLPGMKVDAEGKITSQGKKIDQVLVDGDEFFGTDPTVATKNLNAKAVESVQVYEAKNEQATDDGNETIQVLNLKLKEDAKKGYFGKVTGASDFQRFHEAELLANKFNKKQKISVFGLASNTPRSNIGWRDTYSYGLNTEYVSTGDDDESERYWFNGGRNQNKGIPQTIKTGIYYTDQLTPKTKISSNYSYTNYQLNATSETKSTYFLSDTTYSTENQSVNNQLNEAHNVTFNVSQKLDSLTELKIVPVVKINSSSTSKNEKTVFLNDENESERITDIVNTNKFKSSDINTTAILTRKFKKKHRLFQLNYNNVTIKNSSEGLLFSNNTYLNNSINSNDSINQQKLSSNTNNSHNAIIKYIEPITKKVKIEFSYNGNYTVNTQQKETFNYSNGEYSLQDSMLTNNFENTRITNRLGVKYIYAANKQELSFGAKARNISIENINLVTQKIITQNVNNLLPFINYEYKFSDSRRLGVDYSTSSELPNINQLQPVQDNTNPNQIKNGNPNLLPTFKQNVSASFDSYKAITGNYVWISADYSNTTNAFTNSIEYDTIGRTITTPMNTNGNYFASGNISGTKTLFSGLLSLSPDLSYNYNKNTNFINKQQNVTTQSNVTTGLQFTLKFDTLEFSAGYRYDYNNPKSTINTINNQPYNTQTFFFNTSLQLPFKFSVESSINYTINSQRAEGYNINIALWNASIEKRFLKNESLILSVEATDILNQNINTSRTVQDNIITDNKTNIISRYVLLKVIYKFNSDKNKKDEMDF
ncbi:MAG: outer membrane beta-barrel protein [Bacteroidia bacterium]